MLSSSDVCETKRLLLAKLNELNKARPKRLLLKHPPNVLGVRATLELMAAQPRLSTTVIQTVGNKGYDGFAFAVVNG